MVVVSISFNQINTLATRYSINAVNNTIGLYYHEEEHLKISNDKWTLIVYKDMQTLKETLEYNNEILKSLIDVVTPNQNAVTKVFYSEVQTHISLLEQLSNSLNLKFEEVFADTKRYKRGILNGIGTIWKAITGNLDASDGEFYSNCINKILNDEHQLENLMKNQISVTTSVIKNFNETIQKLRVDEETFNKDIQIIDKAIHEIRDDISIVHSKLRVLEICEHLMESYLFLENELNDILNSITFARLKIIHSSIITPKDLITSLQQISQSLQRNNLPLTISTTSIAQYLDIIELQAFQTESKIVFVLKIPLIEPELYTIYKLYPIPVLDNRTGLHHILTISQKYIAKDDDSLMFIPLYNLNNCKNLMFRTKLCSNMLPYPIDSDAICEAQILKNPISLPKTCQSTIVFAKNYNIQELENNVWLILVSDPLHITIKCLNGEPLSKIINKTSILQLTLTCNAYIGNTKVQPKANQGSEIKSKFHSVNIPYDCCQHLPNTIKQLDLKPLKLNNLNTEDLEIAKYKLDQYSNDLDKLINEPFVSKHISWFTYFIIVIIVLLILLYIFCKCKNKRNIKIGIQSNSNQPPKPPRGGQTLKRIVSFFPRRRPSVGLQENIEEEEIELNSNSFTKNYA